VEWNLADLFERAADTVPEREALVAGDARLRYAELDRQASRFAHHLAARGIGPGEHVGIYAWNCVEWIVAMLGIFKIRAVPINVNYRYVEEELAYLFDNADLVAVVHAREFAPRIAAIRGGLPRLRHFVAIEDGSRADLAALGSLPWEEALASGSPDRDFAPRSGDDLYVLYTGGTTGMPKGVMWRQHDVIFALGGGIDHATGVPAEKPGELAAKSQKAPPLCALAIPPLMHGACQWATIGSLLVGNKAVLYCAHSFDADLAWRLVERERANVVQITGDAMARPLVEALEGGGYDVSSLVVVASSAAIFSPVVKKRLKDRLPNLVVVDSFGSSEGGFNGTSLYRPGDEATSDPGVVRVAPGRDTTVISEDGRILEPGSGEVGKLARGGNIPLGYYKDPAKTAEVFVEVGGRRWSIPGDFATIEADGSIRLLGRGSVCINSGGEKIFPEEVEAAVKTDPDVFDAVVVGVPDERWGQRVAVVVEPRPGRTPSLASIDRHCRRHVAGYKVPRDLVLVERIVRSPSGKPDYPWAQKLARERLAG
jgi:3-oxocholest-4-en-26-oate---CoA ligase